MEEVVKIALQYGVVGVVALIAMIVARELYKENRKLREDAVTSAKEAGSAIQGESATHAEASAAQVAKFVALVDAQRLECDRRVEVLATLFASKTETMILGFTSKLESLDKQHHEQEDELTDRLIKASETYAEKNAQLTEKVTLLVDSVKRRSE